MPFRLSAGGRVLRRPGVDQRGLPLGRANQDRIALADVEEVDGDRTRAPPDQLERSWPSPVLAGPTSKSPIRTAMRRNRRVSQLDVPAGIGRLQVFLDLPGLFAKLLRGLGVTLEAQCQDIAGPGRGRRRDLGTLIARRPRSQERRLTCPCLRNGRGTVGWSRRGLLVLT